MRYHSTLVLKLEFFEIVTFGTVLLVVGASILIGGLKYKTQKFNVKVNEVSSSMLLFVCIPDLFTHTVDSAL